jgi:D-allulose-6-phosphate 3-epimerase
MRFFPSLMCMDFLNLGAQVRALNSLADGWHADIMDGHFCPNMAVAPSLIAVIARASTLPIEAHLMTTRPNDWIDRVAQAGATIISPHAETILNDAFRVMDRIHALGCQTGVTLSPATPLAQVEAYLPRVDVLTLMTVDVGYSGQAFIAEMLGKIRLAAAWRAERGYTYRIQIDGACNRTTYRVLAEAGAECLVMGATGLFSLDADPAQAWANMLREYGEQTAPMGEGRG